MSPLSYALLSSNISMKIAPREFGVVIAQHANSRSQGISSSMVARHNGSHK